jgi:hypothetical protein
MVISHWSLVIFSGHFGWSSSLVIAYHPYTHFDPNFSANAVGIFLTAGCGYISS